MHSSTKPSPGINYLPRGYIPTQNSDILCGRGKANAKHPANKLFLRVIESCIEDYLAATSRVQKSAIVTSVVSKVYDSGMRFVDMDMAYGQYVELSSDRAHAKVGHAIRDVCKQRKKAQEPSYKASLKQRQTKEQHYASDLASSSSYAVSQVCSTSGVSNFKSRVSDMEEDQPDNVMSAMTQQIQYGRCSSDESVSRKNSWLFESARKVFSQRAFSFSNHVPLEQFAKDGELGEILFDLGQKDPDGTTNKKELLRYCNHEDNQGNRRESCSLVGANLNMAVDDVLSKVFGDSPLPVESNSAQFGSQDVENLSEFQDDLNPIW